MERRAVEQGPDSGAARPPERPRRTGAAPVDRPISTGNLLADCERWCRDHLPRRTPRTPPPGRPRTP